MREILFRGKAINGGQWIYGHMTEYAGTAQIWENTNDGTWNAIVDPATVGQYTGLTDKNGVKIFEEDIVQIENPTPFKPYVATIKYEGAAFTWGVYMLGEFKNLDKVEAIGNIHDNPELMEGGAT